jgi:hypothetical protein
LIPHPHLVWHYNASLDPNNFLSNTLEISHETLSQGAHIQIPIFFLKKRGKPDFIMGRHNGVLESK